MVARCLQELSEAGNTSISAHPIIVEPIYVMVLLQPGSADFNSKVESLLVEFLQSRSRGERVGLFLWKEAVVQVADFTSSRSALLSALRRATKQEAPSSPLTPDAALTHARETVARVAPHTISRRVILSVLPVPPGTPPSDSHRAIDVFWLVHHEAAASAPNENGRMLWSNLEQGRSALEQVADALDASATQGFIRVGHCERPGRHSNPDDGAGSRDSAGTSTAGQSAAESCDAARIARATVPGRRRIDFVLSPEAEFVYEARSALTSISRRAARTRAKREFRVKVRLPNTTREEEALIRIRGAGTLLCDRKNFGVRLTSGAAAKLFDDKFLQSFILLSLCHDANLLKTHLGASLYRHFGLFPFRFGFVELSLNGHSNGVYLLLDDPVAASVEDHAGVAALIRRSYDWEAEAFRVNFDVALEQYKRVLESIAEAGESNSPEALSDRVDLDQYLRWLALNSALQNGDYVDEAWILATQNLDKSNGTTLFFSMFAWDFDSIFTECHQGGNPFHDSHALLYCAESRLDGLILDTPDLYARYVDELESVLLELTEREFARFAAATYQSVRPYLEVPDITRTMTQLDDGEPGWDSPDRVKKKIGTSISELVDRFGARRLVLLQRIQTYRTEDRQRRLQRNRRWPSASQ
jgi:hypothetical protein